MFHCEVKRSELSGFSKLVSENKNDNTLLVIGPSASCCITVLNTLIQNHNPRLFGRRTEADV